MRPVGRPALLLAVAGVLASTLVPATGASARESAAKNAPTVKANVVDYDFEWPQPGGNTIDAGTTVTFTNIGKRPHTVTDRGGTFDKLVMPGDSVSIAFTIPGNISFFCKIRAAAPGSPEGMEGVVKVKPTVPAMVNRIQAVDPARYGSKRGFDPTELTVSAGSTVQLANIGGSPHTLTADDGTFDTGKVAPGAEGGRFAGTSATVIVTQPGTYPFHCAVHPTKMRGVLTVEGPSPAELAATETTQPLAAQKTPTAAATKARGDPGSSGGTWVTGILIGLGGLVLGLIGMVAFRNRQRVHQGR